MTGIKYFDHEEMLTQQNLLIFAKFCTKEFWAIYISMTFKRKRNIKLDVLATYNVLLLETFSKDELEDYEEAKATGMEEDEEKEVHLREVMEDNKKSIPLPVITQIENECKKYYKPSKVKNFVNYQSDVPNHFVLSIDETRELNDICRRENEMDNEAICPKSGLFTLVKEYSVSKSINSETGEKLDFYQAVACFGDDSKYYSAVKNKEFVDFVFKRTLIRFEKLGFEAYCCFKPRILQPKIKSRKNEQNTIEKLHRMYTEFKAISDNCKLMETKITKELELIEYKCHMFTNFGHLFNSSIKRKLEYQRQKQDVNEIFYMRKKYRKLQSEPILNDDFYNNYIKPFLHVTCEEGTTPNKSDVYVHKETYEGRFDCELK